MDLNSNIIYFYRNIAIPIFIALTMCSIVLFGMWIATLIINYVIIMINYIISKISDYISSNLVNINEVVLQE